MSDLIAIPPSNHLDQDDEEALELFNQVAGEISSQHPRNSSEVHQNIEPSDDEAPVFSRLSKIKKESKMQRKKKKMKEKLKLKKKKKLRRDHESPAPKKKIKRDPSTRKKTDREDGEDSFRHDDKGSSEFDSDSASEDLDLELKNLNPDFAEGDQSPKKRLKKSGRKEKIQHKQGFKLAQLGNDPEADLSKSLKMGYSDDDDYSADVRKKKSNKRKHKIAVPSNAEIMDLLKQQGVVESEEEEQVNKDYDRGIDMIQNIKKKAKDGISIKNRLFGDLEMDLQKEDAQIVEAPQNFELELNPKKSGEVSSQRLSFFSRAEGIKKSRGLQAQVDAEEYQRKADQKVKKSMAKLITSLTSQDFHDDLDLEVRVPTIARGKSASLINNTVFLRSQLSRQQIEEQNSSSQALKQTKSLTINPQSRREMSRQDLFKEIQEQTRLRRSKYISNEELKNSFRKTNLEELEQFRKKIQEKKRQEALSDHESDSVQLDSEMKAMIEKEEQICGDLNQEENEEEDKDWEPEQEKNEVQELLEEEAVQSQSQQQNQAVIEKQQLNQAAQQELEQYNEILNELHSVSQSHKSPQQEEQDEQEEEEEQKQGVQNGQNQQSHHSEVHSKMLSDQIAEKKSSQREGIEVEDEKLQMENQKRIKELEDEGIHMVKRRKNAQYNQIDEKDYLVHDQVEGEQPIVNPQIVGNENNRQEVDENDDEFNNFRKLRRIAVVIARKKKEREMGRQFAAQYIEHEAEQGSDNQDHDDIVKRINHAEEDKQFEGMDLDADLVELIDNAVDINQENQYEAFRKYLEDVRMQDREQIRKIVRGQFWNKHQDLEEELEEDQRKRIERMEEVMSWMKRREEEEGQGIYVKEPQPENKDSDQGSIYGDKDKKEDEELLDQQASEELNPQQKMEKLNRYLEEEMPSIKREHKPVGNVNFMVIPQSVKRDSSKAGSQKRISMSKFGSFTGNEVNSQTLIHKKSTSSLVNQILNKNANKPRKPIANLFPKSMSKKK